MHSYNLQAVAASSYPQVIRDAATKLASVEYLDVGTFLKELSQPDLETLIGMCSRITVGVDTEEDFDSLIILSGMLAQCEGISLDEANTANRTSNLMILLTFEDLYRKGIIDFFHDKVTLGSELLDDTIARLK